MFSYKGLSGLEQLLVRDRRNAEDFTTSICFREQRRSRATGKCESVHRSGMYNHLESVRRRVRRLKSLPAHECPPIFFDLHFDGYNPRGLQISEWGNSPPRSFPSHKFDFECPIVQASRSGDVLTGDTYGA